MMQLETPRMLIRNFLADDADDLHEILGDAQTMEYSEPPYDLEQTKRFLESFCIARGGAVAAVDRQTNKVIGYILFTEVEAGEYELGWFFNRHFWRKGYAYEACKGLMDYAFGTMGVEKIFAETIDGVKAVGLMEKLGMHLEKIQHDHEHHRTWYIYGMEKCDWRIHG